MTQANIPVNATQKAPNTSCWQVSEQEIFACNQQANASTHAKIGVRETLFSLGNGLLGTRGTLDVAPLCPELAAHTRGTYLNGAYTRSPIAYGESAFGFATHNQQMLRLPDAKLIRCFLIGAAGQKVPFTVVSADQATITFCLSTASVKQTFVLTTDNDEQCQLTITQFIPRQTQQVIAMRYRIEATNFSGEVIVESGIYPVHEAALDNDDPRAGEAQADSALRPIMQRVSPKTCAMVFDVEGVPQKLAYTVMVCADDETKSTAKQLDTNALQHSLHLTLVPNQKVAFSRLAYIAFEEGDADVLLDTAQHALHSIANTGIEHLWKNHCAEVMQFWQTADTSIHVTDYAKQALFQQSMRFNALHLHMSAGDTGTNNIAAKGLSGHGYDGHYFWDSEIYILPFFTYRNPLHARQLLQYRHHILPFARERARQLGHQKGALIPWRTIAGEECSAYFPASTAQYHINAAVAYAIRQYWLATEDTSMLTEFGAELLFETARLWPQLGHVDPHSQQFHIAMVTGPDEYTAMVNNNFYTNAMAKLHLEFAVEVANWLQQQSPQTFAELTTALALTQDEIASWQQIAATMYLPYDAERGINPQDDSFLQKPVWDLSKTAAAQKPLLLHFHPLVIYRHQVIKQADTVLAGVLLDDRMAPNTKAANLAYYTPLTTHDSTLSACAHAMAHCDVGNTNAAMPFFEKTVLTDVANLHNNTHYGIHTANMGGAWMCIVNGFAGFRVRQNKETHTAQIHFAPQLPAEITTITFCITVHQRVIKVTVTQSDTHYQLISGEPVDFFHDEQPQQLTTAHPLTLTNSKHSQAVQ